MTTHSIELSAGGLCDWCPTGAIQAAIYVGVYYSGPRRRASGRRQLCAQCAQEFASRTGACVPVRQDITGERAEGIAQRCADAAMNCLAARAERDELRRRLALLVDRCCSGACSCDAVHGERDALPHLTEATARDIDAELERARAKFPGRAHLVVALMEEVGELAQAVLQGQGAERIRAEAIQVACVAVRICDEGDADFEEGPKP